MRHTSQAAPRLDCHTSHLHLLRSGLQHLDYLGIKVVLIVFFYLNSRHAKEEARRGESGWQVATADSLNRDWHKRRRRRRTGGGKFLGQRQARKVNVRSYKGSFGAEKLELEGAGEQRKESACLDRLLHARAVRTKRWNTLEDPLERHRLNISAWHMVALLANIRVATLPQLGSRLLVALARRRA